MAAVQAFVLLASVLIASGQRPFFAGSRPIGFPELLNRTTTPRGLEDKFGEGTTQRLPIEAQGDRDLIDRLSKLPIDKQPFWFINWQAYEGQRDKPQTYPQKPNPFIDPPSFQNTNSVPPNQLPNSGLVNRNPGFVNPNPGFTNPNAGISTISSSIGNSNTNTNVQPSNWKVQNPFDTKTGSSNVDNRYGTENNTAGTINTGTKISTATQDSPASNKDTSNVPSTASTGPNIDANNANTGDKKNILKPVTFNSDDIKKLITNPGLVSNIDKVTADTQEENEFEDIQVKKFVTKN